MIKLMKKPSNIVYAILQKKSIEIVNFLNTIKNDNEYIFNLKY